MTCNVYGGPQDDLDPEEEEKFTKYYDDEAQEIAAFFEIGIAELCGKDLGTPQDETAACYSLVDAFFNQKINEDFEFVDPCTEKKYQINHDGYKLSLKCSRNRLEREFSGDEADQYKSPFQDGQIYNALIETHKSMDLISEEPIVYAAYLIASFGNI